MNTRHGILLVALLGCSRPTPVPCPAAVDENPPPTTGTVHRFQDNFGEPGCAPKGEVLTLHGRIRVAPFRKGTNGALFDDDAGETWVLSYRAEGALLRLDGAHVEIRGHACDKRGEALAGKHFDLDMVIENAP
jgi:hypothetical protein